LRKLKVLDLFSGIGGFSLGLESTGGFETVAFCEIDEHCQRVLNKHWPVTTKFKDIKNLTCLGEHSKIDVIVGGFPCQDISVAGQQRGISDGTRSGLWFEYKRIIETTLPSYVIIENVANLRSNGLVTVLQDLWKIGYDAEWEIISARSVGAPHLRERIWIVAYPTANPYGSNQGGGSWQDGTDSGESRNSSENEQTSATNSHNFRFWPTFTSEKEKSEWWTEATAKFRSRWEVESSVCRVDDGLHRRLDRARAQRIRQLGNSVVPAIPEIIGNRILFHEAVKCL
jgi:DNA (cytosine-5)-methyltransferase 1